MVRFEKFKNSLVAGNKPVLQDGLGPLSVRPQAFLSASGGRTDFIWNTGNGDPTMSFNLFPTNVSNKNLYTSYFKPEVDKYAVIEKILYGSGFE